MALGGGNYTVQNKILPGAYINFVSAANVSVTLSDRGIVAMPFELDWGVDNQVFEVTAEEFERNSLQLFGYPHEHEKLKNIREIFLHAKTLYAYKLNSSGVKASNNYAEAVCGGVRGNSLQVSIQKNVDNGEKFDVKLLLDGAVLDTQTVEQASELKPNQFVTWKETSLQVTAATPLTGGTNGSAVTSKEYQTFLNKIESYSYNILAVATATVEINNLVASFCKRMRDERGAKFQAVLYNTAADYEGVINVKNTVSESGSTAALVYWVAGMQAGCAVNKSVMNKPYDGEYTVIADYTQTQLEDSIQAGEFVFHKVGNEIRVLQDINSLVTTTEEKNSLFQDNQTIRVIDQIANDIASLFNTKYLGNIPNNESGRISLWSDIVKHHEQLQELGAIENFSDSDVTVSQGDTKKSVIVSDKVTVINAMAQLYMNVVVE